MATCSATVIYNNLYLRFLCDTGFWPGDLSETDHQEDLGVGVRIILKKDLQEVKWADVHRINMAYDRDGWRALLIAVINPWVPQKGGNFLKS